MQILSTLIFFPVIGAVILALSNIKNTKYIFSFGILVAIIELILSLVLFAKFDNNVANFQFSEVAHLIYGYDVKYILGVDGMSLLLVLLTTFLTPICLFISVKSVTNRVKQYVACFLLIEAFVIGSFLALDLLLFYIFFEVMLIPMFLVIGIWGGKDRIYASYKFFLYTLFGSVFFLVAIITIYVHLGTTDIVVLAQKLPELPLGIQKWLWLGFFISFAIKVPMFPVHTWLPDAHVQAPTAGSVILAGILIKLGAYGFIRFSLPFFPAASEYYAYMVFILSVFAIIYGSLVALMQTDMKKMIAYSSVAHMGFVTIGIFSFNQQGLDGAIMQMISHGLVSGALFICVGVIYDRLHTKEIAKMGGIAEKMPNFATLAMIFTMASVGLPGTSGFVGEFLAIIGTFLASKEMAVLATIGVVLGACYMLWLYKRVWFSEITNEDVKKMAPLNKFEFGSLAIIAFFVILFGIKPNLVLEFFNFPVSNLVSIYK